MDSGSAVVSQLADASLRALGVAAAAWVAIRLLRVRGAAGRHAVWTLAAAAMLLMAFLRPLLPPIPLPVLAPVERVAAVSTVVVPLAGGVPSGPGPDQSQDREGAVYGSSPAPRSTPIDWRLVAAAVYGAGVLVFAGLLAAGYAFTGWLVRASRRVDCRGVEDVFESDWIAVPMTVGLLRPKILLPAGWRQWPAGKLDAALAHERMHVRRADWAVAVLAGLNRCVFWFHPLSWWLGRQLAALAEQACDDATVLELGGRECYAQTLLDMAAAVQRGRRRLLWEAIAMARKAEVGTRIERILDETREIPRGWSRARWLAVAACSLPLFYMTAAVQVTRAQGAAPAPAPASQPQESAPQADAAPAPQPAQSAPDAKSAQGAPRRIDLPGSDMERLLSHKVEPAYPPKAIEAGVEGEVILATVIGADGHVKSARPIYGHPLLMAAAQAALMQYVYRPRTLNAAEMAEIASTATVIFRLPGAADPSPQITRPVVIYKTEPEYSSEARKARVNGKVQLRLVVGKDGIPGDIRVVKSESPLLDQPALDAAGKWRFKPGSRNGVPVETEVTVEMNFRLFPQQAAPTTEPSGDALPPPMILYQREAQYPRIAAQMGQRGTVELQAIIGVDGRVKSVKVLKGPPMLAKAAQDAVMQWVYKPTLLNGVPVENETHVSIKFDGGAAASPEPAPAPGGDTSESGRPPQGSEATAAKTPAPARQISPARLVYKRDPEYPKDALGKGRGTFVQLQAIIGVDGRVKAVTILDGQPVLAKAAEDAVMQWVYEPTKLNGIPVESETHISINFDRQTKAPAPPPDSTQPPEQGTIEPVPIHKVNPLIPEMARRMGVSGIVKVVATIGTDGHVRDVKAIEGPPALQQAVVDAVKQWIYKPILRDGVPVESETRITVNMMVPRL